MEVLVLLAVAFMAGRQVEAESLGISPADRSLAKEHRRHERRVREIAAKHGAPLPEPSPLPGTSSRAEPGPVVMPETFRSGYRSHAPIERTYTRIGRGAGKAGAWTARGIAWARDTGRSAVHEYRERRTAAGHDDPAPVVEPIPPAEPAAVPPMPTHPPTVHETPEPTAGPGPPKEPDESEDWGRIYAWEDDWSDGPPTVPVTVPAPRTSGETDPDSAPVVSLEKTEPEKAPESTAAPKTEPDPVAPKPEATTNGKEVGRMAAEVTYESVMDESDELSLMCDDDVKVYGRIGVRCEREIGRADALIADARNAGVGEKVIGWISRALEKYQAINANLGDLTQNTIAQGEAVVKAKALLEAGQGVYAGIAKDMESVAERDFYVSDAVDGEDTSAHTETYETRGA